jgi:DNA-binding transcriptional ArsR family regulator
LTIQVIDDPEKVKILVEETRQKIICMLGRGSMSLSELARALNKTPPTVFYHIKKLASVGLIKLEKTKVVNNNLVEKYYSLAIPSSCLISLRVSKPERGPVPPKKLSKTESRVHRLCVDICWDDVLAKLGLKWDNNGKQQRINIVNKIFEKTTFEAGEAFKEATQQINIKLSSQDQRKLQHLARAIFTLTFCKMLEKPENLNMLKDLLQSLRS